MKPRDNVVYLKHMIEAVEAIDEYLSDVDEPGFRENRLLQDGVIRQIQIVGDFRGSHGVPYPARSSSTRSRTAVWI